MLLWLAWIELVLGVLLVVATPMVAVFRFLGIPSGFDLLQASIGFFFAWAVLTALIEIHAQGGQASVGQVSSVGVDDSAGFARGASSPNATGGPRRYGSVGVNTRMLAAPMGNAQDVGTLEADVRFEIIDTADDWYQVRDSTGTVGWIPRVGGTAVKGPDRH